MKFLKILFSSSEFMPHGYCYLWKPGLVRLHVISDSMIGLAYLFIPIILVCLSARDETCRSTGCSSVLECSSWLVAPHT
jgi:hypothetical protein